MSVSHHGPVNPSNPNFSNISFEKAIKKILVVSKNTEKWLPQPPFSALNLLYDLKTIFLSDVTFPPWPGNSVNLNFSQC